MTNDRRRNRAHRAVRLLLVRPEFRRHLPRGFYVDCEEKNVRRKNVATILVIEPEVLVRASISEFLRSCGYRVIEGVTADDVWAAIGAGTSPDIVLAEVQLT